MKKTVEKYLEYLPVGEERLASHLDQLRQRLGAIPNFFDATRRGPTPGVTKIDHRDDPGIHGTPA